tara:strand:- start:893 stop:4222 length:3330 start_codon:yes stop_codon:yes gene_type:complete
MQMKSQFRRRLLGSTALAAGAFLWAASPAHADPAPDKCVSVVSLTGETITCSDYSYTSIYRNADDVTVTLNPAAEVAFGGVSTVELYGARNSVTLNGASTIYGRDSRYSVFLQGEANAVTLSGGSSIYMSGEGAAHSKALKVEGEGAVITLNEGSDVTLVGNNSNYVNVAGTGVVSYAGGATLTLNAASTINVSGGTGRVYGDSTYIGATLGGVSQSVALNTGSSINVFGTGIYGGHNIGLRMSGRPSDTAEDAGTVTLNSGSSINVTLSSGTFTSVASGIEFSAAMAPRRMMYGYGYASSVTLNDDSSINIYGQGGASSTSNYYSGIVGRSFSRSTVTLNDTSSINIGRDDGYGSGAGIRLGGGYFDVVMNDKTSIVVGGALSGASYGMILNGDHISVTLSDMASVQSDGLVQSNGINVRGSDNSITLNDDSSVSGNCTAILMARSFGGSSVELNGHATALSTFGEGINVYDSTYSNVTLNDNARVAAAIYNGIVLHTVNDSTVTLNGNSRVEAGDDYAGILVTGNYSAYASEYRSRGNSIVAKAGTTIIGGTGILIESGYYNSVFLAGYVEGTSGVAIDFSNTTNSTLTLATGATLVGTVNGRTGGYDNLFLQGEGTLTTSISNFDRLTVDAEGIWNLAADLNLDNGTPGAVAINSGTLAVNADLYAGGGVAVESGATLGGSGTVHGAVVVKDGGTLAPGNSPGTINVVGNVNFNAGSIFAVQFEGADADRLNVNGNVTVAPGAIIQPDFIGGVDGFTGIILQATGPIFGTFGVGSGGAVYQTPGEVHITATSASSMSGSTGGGMAAGFSFLDTVMTQAATIDTNSNLWASAIIDRSDRTSTGSSRGYHQTSHGGAFGGALMQTGDATVGLAGGFIDTTVDTVTGSSKTRIDGFNLAAYGTYRFGGTVLTAVLSGAYQDQDVSRNVLVGGVVSQAKGSPKAWLGGAGFGIARPVALERGFTLTPKANIGWLHMSRDAYSETGGGNAAMSVDQIATDTVRGQVGAELSLMIKNPNDMWSVRPNIHAGLAREWRGGDKETTGTFAGVFVATGQGFRTQLDNRDQTYMAIGAGVDVTVGHGITAFAGYDGSVGGDAERSGGFRIGARLAL